MLLIDSFLLQAIRFFMSSNLRVQGLEVKNSPQFHFKFDNCQNVLIESLTIKSPALSPNTDGIHLQNSNNVKIYNSLVSNGNYIFNSHLQLDFVFSISQSSPSSFDFMQVMIVYQLELVVIM